MATKTNTPKTAKIMHNDQGYYRMITAEIVRDYCHDCSKTTAVYQFEVLEGDEDSNTNLCAACLKADKHFSIEG